MDYLINIIDLIDFTNGFKASLESVIEVVKLNHSALKFFKSLNIL